MLKKQIWLQNIGAVATERGWEHPDSGELLVAVKGLLKYYTPDGEKIQVPKPKEIVEDVETKTETFVEPVTTKTKQRKSKKTTIATDATD